MVAIGAKFGRLTLIGFPEGRPLTGGKADFECECGVRKQVRLSHVTSGATSSCGCVKRKHYVVAGQKFGRLTVVSNELHRHRERLKAVCKCSCGVEKLVAVAELCVGSTRSCGCLVVDTSREVGRRHGYEQHPAYKAWCGMRERCLNPASKSYHHYGGRGISICAEWANDCKAFCDWADANGHEPGLEIDRRDNNGNYGPSNCRFVTRIANTRNRRSNVKVTAFGETKLLVEWSEDVRCKIGYEALRIRVQKGVPPEIAMTTPIQSGKPINAG